MKEIQYRKIILLVAGIILLLHYAVPHHHHQGQVCLITEECRNCDLPHDHHNGDHDHQEDPENKSNHCCISDFITVSQKNTFRQLISDSSENKNYQNFDSILISFDPIRSTFHTVSPPPEINKFYPLFIRFSIGLRGPPAA